MTSHLEEGMLHELLDGEIPSSALPPIQAHLAGCAECRSRLEDARGWQSASDGLLVALDHPAAAAPTPPTPSSGPRRIPWIRDLAWAATVVIAVGAGYYGRGRAPAVPTEPAPQRQVSADQPVSPDTAEVGKSTRAEQTVETAEPMLVDVITARAVAALEKRADVYDAERVRPTRNDMVATGAVAAPALAAKLSPVREAISFPEALRRLNGTIRLIEGLVPDRLDAVGPEVRVVYPLASGELYLIQEVVHGQVTYRLVAPAGFPADSLQRLRELIRE